MKGQVAAAVVCDVHTPHPILLNLSMIVRLLLVICGQHLLYLQLTESASPHQGKDIYRCSSNERKRKCRHDNNVTTYCNKRFLLSGKKCMHNHHKLELRLQLLKWETFSQRMVVWYEMFIIQVIIIQFTLLPSETLALFDPFTHLL